jgi:plastocyanin
MMKSLALVSALSVATVAGCGGSAAPGKAGSARRPGFLGVEMKDIRFQPDRIVAVVGDTVTWTNRDMDTPHNVTYVSGPRFKSSATFKFGHSFSIKLAKPGVIRYLCTIHPGMDGSIVVKARS